MYDGMAVPSGIYRSRLERDWANRFRMLGLETQYHDERWYDFVVDGHYVEIKPDGQSFLEAAVSRMPFGKTLIVIQGGIYYYKAWRCQRHLRNPFHVDCTPVRLGELFNLYAPKKWSER